MYHVCAWCPKRPEEVIRFPGTGITVSCHVGSGNRTWVLGKSCQYSLTAEPSFQVPAVSNV